MRKTEKPHSGSVKESIPKYYCKKIIRKICKKLHREFTQHRCCIVWFWLDDALWKIAFSDGHKLSIYKRTQLLVSVCEMNTDNASVQCADSGYHLGVRGVMSKYFVIEIKDFNWTQRRRWKGEDEREKLKDIYCISVQKWSIGTNSEIDISAFFLPEKQHWNYLFNGVL